MTPVTDREAQALRLPRHDWSARARSTALEALRYTKFVGVMKRALQVAAFAVIAAVLGFFFFQRQPARITMGFEQLGHVDNDLAMVKPRLSGQDGEGQSVCHHRRRRRPGRRKSQACPPHQGRGRSGPRPTDSWINADAAPRPDRHAGRVAATGWRHQRLFRPGLYAAHRQRRGGYQQRRGAWPPGK